MTDTWGFRAGIGINDTLFQTFEVANIDWSGNEMPSPDQSLNLGLPLVARQACSLTQKLSTILAPSRRHQIIQR